jgi:hypothetical protein
MPVPYSGTGCQFNTLRTQGDTFSVVVRLYPFISASMFATVVQKTHTYLPLCTLIKYERARILRAPSRTDAPFSVLGKQLLALGLAPQRPCEPSHLRHNQFGANTGANMCAARIY